MKVSYADHTLGEVCLTQDPVWNADIVTKDATAMYPAIFCVNGVEVCFTHHALRRSLERSLCTLYCAAVAATCVPLAAQGANCIYRHDGVEVVAQRINLINNLYFIVVLTMYEVDDVD